MSTYHQWLSAPIRIGDVDIIVASKAGVQAHGAQDPAAAMLAHWVAVHEPVVAVSLPGAPLSVHLQAGHGLSAAVAALRGYDVLACDRYAPHAAATARTLALSGIDGRSAVVQQTAIPGAPTTGGTSNTNPADAIAGDAIAEGVVDGRASLVTIRIPTDRIGVQLAVAAAFRMLAVNGVCLLAGGNDEGARPAARLLHAVFGEATVESQHSGHRMVRAVKRRERPGDDTIFALPWLDPGYFQAVPVQFGGNGGPPLAFDQFTRPGVFSWKHPDEATVLLADVMNIGHGDRVLDLGCGAGALGVVASIRAGVPSVLVDADADAVRGARRTAREAGVPDVRVLASDVGSAVEGETFDVVVSNPPFHVGKSIDLTVPRAFIDDAWRALVPGGRLYLVANRTLPYERLIDARFGEVRTAHDGRRFKVLGAVRT